MSILKIILHLSTTVKTCFRPFCGFALVEFSESYFGSVSVNNFRNKGMGRSLLSSILLCSELCVKMVVDSYN